MKSKLALAAKGLGLLLFAFALAFVIANLHTHDAGPPVFSVEDLPALPPAEDNGWLKVPDKPPKTLVSELLSATLVGDVDRVALRQRAPEGLRAAVAACAPAFEAPRFVDACPMTVDASCPALAIDRCSQVMWTDTLLAAAAGDDVHDRAARLLSRSAEHASTARGFLGQTLAQHHLARALDAMALLKRWRGDEAMAAAVAATEIDAERGPGLALVGEYLFFVHALDQVGGHPDVTADFGGPVALFDEGATRAFVDAAYVRARDGGTLSIPPQTESFGWWFDNATGKLLLDALGIGKAPYQRIVELARDNVAKRAALLR